MLVVWKSESEAGAPGLVDKEHSSRGVTGPSLRAPIGAARRAAERQVVSRRG